MLTLVIGGARSGKSRYAQSLADGRAVLYVATADPSGDDEMKRRIERHRRDRPEHWTTVEAPLLVADAVRDAAAGTLVLVDCVTVWLSNLAYAHRGVAPEARERSMDDELSALIDAAEGRDVILVSNEVGSGIVPDSAVAREFRDLQGRANQTLAAAAERVVLMVAGIPTPIKG